MRVMITGCSSGIGLSLATHLAQRGDAVVATVRDPSNADALGDAIREANLDVAVVGLDVGDRDSVDRGVAEALGALGGLDAVVNNAGVSQLTAVEDLDEGDAAALMNTNFLGPLRVCQAVLPTMRAQGHGTIVNVSSMNARAAFAFTGAYSASKAALESLSEALALEVDRFGVRVAIVEPGVFDTAIADKALPRRASRHYPDEALHLEEARAAALGSAPPVADAARAIAAVLDDPAPPLRTPVGRDAVGILRRRTEMDDAEFFTWVRSVTRR